MVRATERIKVGLTKGLRCGRGAADAVVREGSWAEVATWVSGPAGPRWGQSASVLQQPREASVAGAL